MPPLSMPIEKWPSGLLRRLPPSPVNVPVTSALPWKWPACPGAEAYSPYAEPLALMPAEADLAQSEYPFEPPDVLVRMSVGEFAAFERPVEAAIGPFPT